MSHTIFLRVDSGFKFESHKIGWDSTHSTSRFKFCLQGPLPVSVSFKLCDKILRLVNWGLRFFLLCSSWSEIPLSFHWWSQNKDPGFFKCSCFINIGWKRQLEAYCCILCMWLIKHGSLETALARSWPGPRSRGRCRPFRGPSKSPFILRSLPCSPPRKTKLARVVLRPTQVEVTEQKEWSASPKYWEPVKIKKSRTRRPPAQVGARRSLGARWAFSTWRGL